MTELLLTLFEVDLKIKGLTELMLGIESKVKIEEWYCQVGHFTFEAFANKFPDLI